MRRVRTIVFAKAPRAGHAKTRLIPALGAQGAAELARRMLLRTLDAALAADIGPVELCATPAFDDPAWRGVVLPDGLGISDQGDGDLGRRMERAAARALGRGEAVLLVGTDCAEIAPALLRDAAAALACADALIHPVADGGYALLGLVRHSPAIFTGIAWSTGSVAASTIDRIRALGWSLSIGDTLHDIDLPADLRHLR